jgi:hypothetical protein
VAGRSDLYESRPLRVQLAHELADYGGQLALAPLLCGRSADRASNLLHV